MPLPTKTRYTIGEAARFIASASGERVSTSQVIDWGTQGFYGLYMLAYHCHVRYEDNGQISEISGSLVQVHPNATQTATLESGYSMHIDSGVHDGRKCDFVEPGTSQAWRMKRPGSFNSTDLILLGAELDAFAASLAKPPQTSPATNTAPVVNASQTLFDSGLSVREFKTHLLYVPDLLAWAQSKRLHLRTTPPLEGYEFVHIETLLCAIEIHATNLTHDQAKIIVANDPALQARMSAGLGLEQEQFDSYLEGAPAWLVQADAHSQWRKTFAAAIQTGELVPLEFGSKLPIDIAPAPDTATPAPVVAGGKKWTPEKLAELKTYREAHTMPETAVKFGISEQRIRELLPSGKPKAKPFGGLIRRIT